MISLGLKLFKLRITNWSLPQRPYNFSVTEELKVDPEEEGWNKNRWQYSQFALNINC